MSALATPPAKPAAPSNHDYVELKRRVKAAGLLDAKPAYYWMKTAVTFLLLGLAIAIPVLYTNPWIILLSAVFLGFASTQVALLAHDVGHRQGYRGPIANAIARYVFGNVLLGVSHSWWNAKHNQHHATPNNLEQDPDIQFPMIVFSAKQIESRPQWLRPVIAIQAFVLLALLPFQAINMRLSSAQHLFGGKARKPWLQGAGMALHFGLYLALLISLNSWGLAIGFALIHHAVFGLYNSSVFASNHKGMPLTENSGRMDFLREQVLTSRNVHGHLMTDFWYGGLNYQIEHHLFPTMPRCNLAKSQELIRGFCEEKGIAYHATGLWESYKEVFSHLHEASASLRSRASLAG